MKYCLFVSLLMSLIVACNGTFEIGIEPTAMPETSPPATIMPLEPSPSEQASATQSAPSPTPAPPATQLIVTAPLQPSLTPTACQPPTKWVLYTVRPNDTLFNLSQDLNVTVNQLRIANCLEGDTIRIGQQLYVPYLPTPTATSTFTATATYTATSTLTPTPTLEASSTFTATATGSLTVSPSPTLAITP